MITLHEAEVEQYYRPKADSKSILSPQPQDPITLKPVHPEDIPEGCRQEDIKTKWLVENLDEIMREIVLTIVLEEVFEREERLVHDVFIHKFSREFPDFLKAHQIRKLVFGRIVDKMFTGEPGKKAEAASSQHQ